MADGKTTEEDGAGGIDAGRADRASGAEETGRAGGVDAGRGDRASGADAGKGGRAGEAEEAGRAGGAGMTRFRCEVSLQMISVPAILPGPVHNIRPADAGEAKAVEEAAAAAAKEASIAKSRALEAAQASARNVIDLTDE
jgi:hypothetical protein